MGWYFSQEILFRHIKWLKANFLNIYSSSDLNTVPLTIENDVLLFRHAQSIFKLRSSWKKTSSSLFKEMGTNSINVYFHLLSIQYFSLEPSITHNNIYYTYNWHRHDKVDGKIAEKLITKNSMWREKVNLALGI